MSVKAFEPVPVIEKLVQGKPDTQVASLECWEDCLWVGTSDGFVVFYVLQARDVRGRTSYVCALQNQAKVGKKQIDKLMVAPSQKRLIVLSNSRLYILHMHTLKVTEETKPVSDVSLFCRNEARSYDGSEILEISVIRKKGLYHYDLDANGFVPHMYKGVNVEEGYFKDVVAMARDGNVLCLAKKSQYDLLRLDADGEQAVTFVCNFNAAKTIPTIKRVSNQEFLIVVTDGPSSGMFINKAGESTRAPLLWAESPSALAYQFPYFVALCPDAELLVIHSPPEQAPKQAVAMKDCRVLNDTNGQVFVGTGNGVSLLAAVPLESQIRSLFDQKLVTEALALAEVAYSLGDTDLDPLEAQHQHKKLAAVQRQAGFIRLSQGQFAAGLELLAAANTDPREVLYLYGNLLSPGSTFQPTSNLANGLAESIIAVVRASDRATLALDALIPFLKVVREGSIPREWRPDVDTALAQLLAPNKQGDLIDLIKGKHKILPEVCAPVFEKYKRFHALALLFDSQGLPRQALDIWRRLEADEVHDRSYPGLEYVIPYLTAIEDPETVYQHGAWMLKKDPKAVEIFTKRPKESVAKFKPDEVLSFLGSFSDVSTAYLEYLIDVVKTDNEKYHTRLAVFYLDAVKRKRAEYETKLKTLGQADSAALEAARVNFKNLLQKSQFYRVDFILDSIKDTDMHSECAILYGKLGDHERALSILVGKLHDREAAKEYCYQNTRNKERSVRQRLFLSLLKVYLQGDKPYISDAVDLLNSYMADLDVVEVLRLVPSDWSIHMIEDFLTRSIRRHIAASATSRIQRSMARTANLQAQSEYYALAQQHVVVREDSVCDVCGRPLNESPLALYPNGVVTHSKCARVRTMCPLTGQTFGN
eukprot:m.150179 g.150179  ORF g.150179 m.150179 type:complete len:874 (-) comp16875_c0_seq2:376-2997(-)